MSAKQVCLSTAPKIKLRKVLKRWVAVPDRPELMDSYYEDGFSESAHRRKFLQGNWEVGDVAQQRITPYALYRALNGSRFLAADKNLE